MDKPDPSSIVFQPIGVIRSEHTHPQEIPAQPVFAAGCRGRAEVLPQYEEGLLDLEGFSHLFLFFLFHQAKPPQLLMKPYLGDQPHGIFATRGPHRPNPLGFSLVRLIKREGSVLYLDDVDILDGTPLIDIKPFVERFDVRTNTRQGWQAQIDDATARQRGLRGYKPKK